MLTSLLLCLAGAFLPLRTAPQAIILTPQHRLPITGLKVNYRSWSTYRKDSHSSLNSDMDYLTVCWLEKNADESLLKE